MTGKQLNRYAEMIIVCHGDRRYGGETTFEDNVLVSVLTGELKVVQAESTRYCGAGDTVLLPRQQPAILLKYPKDGAAYHAVVLKLPSALVRAYYTQHPPGARRAGSVQPGAFPEKPVAPESFRFPAALLGAGISLAGKGAGRKNSGGNRDPAQP